ncbi:MAG: hypothetical protein Athens071416_50 [Parcubacteria group bacterium Athens0714_16]|nr:MAG: hypothetical protein Athens071416_50 [Parcubacteria group bacterium Athens0714_16]
MIGSIKVERAPTGKPQWVKEAWVGLLLPISFFDDEKRTAYNIVSKKSVKKPKKSCFFVDQKTALDVLKNSNEEAYLWWKNKGYPKKDHYFSFWYYDVEFIATNKKVSKD